MADLLKPYEPVQHPGRLQIEHSAAFRKVLISGQS
jgi:hypothetical protein